jgi:hypothetical protein
MHWKRVWKKTIVVNLRYYSWFCWKDWVKPQKEFNQNSRSWGRDFKSNLASTKQESQPLNSNAQSYLRPLFSAIRNNLGNARYFLVIFSMTNSMGQIYSFLRICPSAFQEISHLSFKPHVSQSSWHILLLGDDGGSTYPETSADN